MTSFSTSTGRSHIAESTEDKEIVLVRGQYLDMEKTKADIESILNKSI